MFNLILGIVVFTFIYVCFMLKGTFKETTNLNEKIATYLVIVLMMLIWLIMPFYSFYNIGVSFLLIVNVVIIKGTQKLYLNNVVVELDRRGKEKQVIKPVKVIYTFVYTPLLVLYVFRFHNTFEMILLSIITLIIVYGAIYLLSILGNTKKGGIISIIFIITIIFAPITLFAITSSSSIESSRLDILERTIVRTKNRIMSGYSSVNLASIEDGSTGEEISDFYIDEDYVYYVLIEADTYVVKVYDINQEKIVFEERILDSEGSIRQSIFTGKVDFFKFENDNLYCFTTDGIYTLNNLELTKVSPFNISYYDQFYLDDELYIYSIASDQANNIYKISDTITLVDVITDTSVTTSVISNKLIIDNGIEIKVYGTDKVYPYQEGFDKPKFVSDSSALFSLIDDDGFSISSKKYGYVNETGETNIITESTIQNRSNSYSINGEYFYKWRYWFSHGRERHFFDDNFESLDMYVLDFVNTDYNNGYITLSRNIDDKYIFVMENYSYKDQTPLFFEVNELVKEETSITIPFSKHISLLSYFLAFSMIVIPTSVAKKEDTNFSKL